MRETKTQIAKRIGAAIDAHLKRFEADPKINAYDDGGLGLRPPLPEGSDMKKLAAFDSTRGMAAFFAAQRVRGSKRRGRNASTLYFAVLLAERARQARAWAFDRRVLSENCLPDKAKAKR
jgi:hypothetical protein